MDADIGIARTRVRERLAANMASGRKDVYQDAMGIADEVKSLLEEGGEFHLSDHMPDEWLHEMAVVGTTDECVATIKALYAAGADSVVLVPMMGNDATLNVYSRMIMQVL
jgi:alkanesulfonate monooxygenase SsuD/methylene tetrahydromethanopterin reductase-like flavin-dependent oxidoreductase (luciferase family)